MQTRIQKWGNSLALRIPKSFAAETQMAQDTLVDIALQDGKLVITPVDTTPTLEHLLARVTPENRHEEQDFGAAMGQEVWE